jgi:hypothetical protein
VKDENLDIPKEIQKSYNTMLLEGKTALFLTNESEILALI